MVENATEKDLEQNSDLKKRSESLHIIPFSTEFHVELDEHLRVISNFSIPVIHSFQYKQKGYSEIFLFQ